jgi:hypothetical protein
MSVEASRKHGAFDIRWPSGHMATSDAVRSAPLLRVVEDAGALDWDAFSARYFSARRRHDLDALSEYAEYRHGLEAPQPRLPRAPTLRLLPNEPEAPAIEAGSDTAGTRRLLAAMAAMDNWEREGGYTPRLAKS